MQGTGNDFVLVEASKTGELDFSELSRWVCHRHTGIGADGLLVLAQDGAGLNMRMWNPDGSLSEMCGNGLRCFARYAIDHGLATGKFVVKTGAGPLECEAIGDDIRISLGMADVFVALRRPDPSPIGLPIPRHRGLDGESPRGHFCGRRGGGAAGV